MKILLTGATGYIGQRLLPPLVEAGHEVICLVRDPRRFALPDTLPEALHARVTVVKADLLRPWTRPRPSRLFTCPASPTTTT